MAEPGARARAFDFVSAFLTDAGFYLLVFTLGYVLDAEGATAAEVALVFGVYTVGYACIAPLLGRASDARGRRRSLLVGALLAVAVAGTLTWRVGLTAGPTGAPASSPPDVPGSLQVWVYGGILVMALSNALFWPAFQARIGDREPDPDALGKAIRSFNIAWTSGKACGFLVAGLLFSAAPGSCLPLVTVAFGGVFLSLLAESDPRARRGGVPQVPDQTPLPREAKRSFLLAALLANLVLWGSLATLKGLAPKLGAFVGASAGQMGALLFASLTAQGVVFLALGAGDGWRYERRTLLLAVPAAGLGMGLWLGAGWVSHSAPLALSLAAAGALLVGGAQAVTYAASVFYSLDYDEHRGLRTGIHEAVLALGGGLEIGGGLLADASGRADAPLLLMLGVGAVAAVGVALLLRGPLPSRDPSR